MRKIFTLLGVLTMTILASCALLNDLKDADPTKKEAAPEEEEGFDLDTFQAVTAALVEDCPVAYNVKLEVGPIGAKIAGFTTHVREFGDEPEHLYIMVDPRQSDQGVLDTLIHEWAHAMVWDASEGEEYAGHGPLWGVAYARAYRAMLKALRAMDDEE